MNKNVEFAERTGTALSVGASKEELFEYLKGFIKKFEEEVTELKDALALKDVIEVLDAHNDIRVYVDQLKDSLEKVGIDVVGSQEAVALNNELKYTTVPALVQEWYIEHKNRGNVYSIFDTKVEGITYYCLKNSENKVVKPYGHPKVDLISFLPTDLLEKPTWGKFFKDEPLF